MTNSPPDLSSLSLNTQQQRLHDNYDYEGNGAARGQYHYATSPGIPIQSQYNPRKSTLQNLTFGDKIRPNAGPNLVLNAARATKISF